MKTKSALIAIGSITAAVLLAAVACKNPIRDKVEAINASESPTLGLSAGGSALSAGGSYNLGATALATTKTATFKISNSGKSDLEASVSASGDFGVASQPSGSIAPGGSSTFVLSFTPTGSEGIKSGTVTIASNDPERESFKFTAIGLGSTIMLPKTGQTMSYATGDDGDLEKGMAWPATRFLPGSDEITDTLTGLTWAMNADLVIYNQAQDPDAPSTDGLVQWSNALAFITYYNGASSYWRLPNRNEMRSLANYGKSDPGSWLGDQGFIEVQSNYYWTSSTDPATSTNAWVADMSLGRIANLAKTGVYFLWPVRTASSAGSVDVPATGQTTTWGTRDDGALEQGSPAPSSRFIDNGDETLTDKLTGLMWRNVAPGSTVTWSDALADATAATTGGHSDWRLPNINELDSLLNGEASVCSTYLQGLGLTSVINARYWSSTTNASTTGNAWYVHLGSGIISTIAKTSSQYYLFVRDLP